MTILNLSISRLHARNHHLRLFQSTGPKWVWMESLTCMSAFLDEFNNLMTHLAILPCNVIVAGDFNFHNHNTTAAKFERGKQIILESGFQQIVDQPTHRQGRILDWVLTRPSDHLLVCIVKVTPNVVNDHNTVQFKICGSQQRPTR